MVIYHDRPFLSRKLALFEIVGFRMCSVLALEGMGVSERAVLGGSSGEKKEKRKLKNDLFAQLLDE